MPALGLFKRLGIAGFWLFLAKGLLWLGFFVAAAVGFT